MRTKKALLIGINYTGTRSALRGCENDVYNMKNFLLENGYSSKDIRTMTEDCNRFSNNIPTKNNIIKALQKLIKGINSNTDLFVHYSGHGTSVPDRDSIPDEDDGRDECICPLDYSSKGLIKDDDIKKILIDPLPQGVKLTILMDCCHSGSICDLNTTYKIYPGDVKSKFVAKKSNKLPNTQAKVVMISGCTDTQTSADYFGQHPSISTRQFQGAMTNAFLNTMKDVKKSGKKESYKRIMKGVNSYILKGRFTQRPQFSSGFLIDLNENFTI